MAEQAFDPLLAELRNVVDRADPIPDRVVAAARASFAWRTIDTELAELVADSSLAGSGVRAAEAARLLTFEADGVEIELEVAETGSSRRLTGQLIPVGAAQVTIRWGDGSLEVRADDLGRFSAEGIPATTVSLEILRARAEHPVVTSWVAI